MKTCTRCKRQLSEGEFRPRKKRQNGRTYEYLNSWCRNCERDYDRNEGAEAKHQRNRAWQSANPEKTREKTRRYRERNAERLRPVWNSESEKKRKRESMRARYAADPEKFRARRRDGYRRNRERELAYAREYRKSGRWTEVSRRSADKHREDIRQRSRERRAKVVGVGTMTLAEWRHLLEVYGHACAYCGAPYEEQDHVVPLSRGGAHVVSNVVPACRDCNRSKGDKMFEEWIGCGEQLLGVMR